MTEEWRKIDFIQIRKDQQRALDKEIKQVVDLQEERIKQGLVDLEGFEEKEKENGKLVKEVIDLA